MCRYVHRVGRTARMGQQGEAILFLLPAEIGYLELLAKTGCRIAEMDLDSVMRALPAVPNQSAVRSLARAVRWARVSRHVSSS